MLPYVFQGGVEQYHWLSATQMIDGLALGETTPGPLIMVVAFVGFVAAWERLFSANQRLPRPAWRAQRWRLSLRFLPSFLFILIGGPLVERTHGELKFTAPLTAVTAAVVGVILNLAVFFAVQVLWPAGIAAAQGAAGAAAVVRGVDPLAAAIGITAFVALARYKIGVIPVILACALVGLVKALRTFFL